MLTLNKKSGKEDETDYLGKVTNMSFEYYDLELQLGPALRVLPNSKIRPIVRGGLSVNEMFSIKTENMDHYKIGVGLQMRKSRFESSSLRKSSNHIIQIIPLPS